MITAITGASGRIGRVTAMRFAEEGSSVALLSRDMEALAKLSGRIEDVGGHALPVHMDVTDPASVAAGAEAVERELGPVDVLVQNAAAFAHRTNVLDTDLEDWERVIRTNLTGPFLVAKAFLPAMIQRGEGGTMIMVSSTGGKRGVAGSAPYVASKFGLNGLSHSLIYELREHDIRVVTVSPSFVDTREGTDFPEKGKGAKLRSEDVAEAIYRAATLPGRALVRDIELWATNP